MQSYYASISSHSPLPVREMNGQDTRGRPFAHKARFDFGNIIGDPFALATVSIGFLAWLITLIASAYAQSQARPGTTEEIPKIIWWSATYEFCVVVGVAMAVAFDSVANYQVAIVGFLSPVLAFASSAANFMVYDKRPSVEAAAAGQILMCMLTIIWIFYFGSTNNASSHRYMDQFSVKDQKGASMRPYPTYRPETASSHHQNPVYSQRLSGLETSSPVSQARNPTDSFAQMASVTSPAGAAGPPSTNGGAAVPDEIVPPTEYPYRAKAIYNYTANPEDANEISFTKHEILEVSDVSGRWWQARKVTGETGIAPSNYLILL